MALYSLFKITVLCALFQAASAAVPTPSCTGDRTEGNPKSSPYGTYSQMDVKLNHGVTIHYIGVTYGQPGTQPFYGPQEYMLDLDGCVITSTNPFVCQPIPKPGGLHLNIPNGMFIPTIDKNAGQMFAPGGDPNLLGPGVGIGSILKIHWCPTEDYFLVNLNGQMLDPLKKAQTSVFATVSPLADASGPVKGSICDPALKLGACNSGTRYSTLECVPSCITGIFPPLPATCQPSILVEGSTCCSAARPCPADLFCQPSSIGLNPSVCINNPYALYLDTVCNKDAVGTCGSALYPTPSGLTCQCELFGCKCKPAVA